MVKTWPIPFFYLAPICLPIMNVGMRSPVPQRSGTFSCILATSGYASKLGPKTWFEKNTTLPAEMWSNLIRRVNNISISQAKYYIYIYAPGPATPPPHGMGPILRSSPSPPCGVVGVWYCPPPPLWCGGGVVWYVGYVWCVWSVWFGMFGKYGMFGMYGRYGMYGMNGGIVWMDGRCGNYVAYVWYMWYVW